MPIILPDNLARYFEAQNRHDIEAMMACFAPDAQVQDEGHEHVGSDAIRAWSMETSAKYRVAVEPLEWRNEDDRIVLTARVSGTFDGSPIVLAYRFGLAGDGRIKSLAIR